MSEKSQDLQSVRPHLQGDFLKQFQKRKEEHIDICLSDQSQSARSHGLDQVELMHEALPELNLDEVSLKTESLGQSIPTPFFISSMTAGHDRGVDLNQTLAAGASAHHWWMGVGSQRRQLNDKIVQKEWDELRKLYPKVQLMGNIGLSQLINTPPAEIQKLVQGLQAVAFIVHVNALQECLQQEGTPQFKGGLQALETLCKELDVPVIVKETGCGFSGPTMKKIEATGVAVIDISGVGGTHWGQVEGLRNKDWMDQAASKMSAKAIAQGTATKDTQWNDTFIKQKAAQGFAGWGWTTLESLIEVYEHKVGCEIWASGGVRNGVEACKLLALGASRVGLAQPLLTAALKNKEELSLTMQTLEYELKTAMFCVGVSQIFELQNKKVLK